ncbi:MAG: M48 family metallopeptidase [Thermoguttaceae bacterium]
MSSKVANPLAADRDLVARYQSPEDEQERSAYRNAILTPLAGPPLEPVRVSARYRLALALVGVFVLLLPLVYFGLLGGLGYLEYRCILSIINRPTPPLTEQQRAELGYGIVAALVLGVTLIVLIRPLLFGWGKDTRRRVTREEEPLLFEFVDNVCRVVGAPTPSRIFIDCEVNAAAATTSGFWGALTGGKKCDLLIGLPLVAGLSTVSFAGVLAHEFGHFTQVGMRRIQYVVRTVIAWFAHIYYYRDGLDRTLHSGVTIGIPWTMLPCLCVVAVVWLIRRVLWCFMTAGHFAAGFMSRQAEFDADTFSTRLVGSETTAATLERLNWLQFADQKTKGDILYMLNEDRLPDNYPILIAANLDFAKQLYPDAVANAIRDSKTHFTDTHPCDRDRIAIIKTANTAGVFNADSFTRWQTPDGSTYNVVNTSTKDESLIKRPATWLFRDFVALSRDATLAFYRDVQNWTFQDDNLRDIGDVVAQMQRETRGWMAFKQFFQDAYCSQIILPMACDGDSNNVDNNVGDAWTRLVQARIRQSDTRTAWKTAYDALPAASEQIAKTTACRTLLLNRKRITRKMFGGMTFKKVSDAEEAVRAANAAWDALMDAMRPRDVAVCDRLRAIASLLTSGELDDALDDAQQLAERFSTLLDVLTKLATMREGWMGSKHINQTLQVIFTASQPATQAQASLFFTHFKDEFAALRHLLRTCHEACGVTPYPFDHNDSDITLAAFIAPCDRDVLEKRFQESVANQSKKASKDAAEAKDGFDTINVMELFELGDVFEQRIAVTYHLALAECAAIALAVENGLGLAPLEQFPETENERKLQC